MLKRLLSTGVALAVLVGGGAVAMEAMGLLRSGPAAPDARRVEATVAHIDATFDRRDLPSEAEAEGLWPPEEKHAEGEPKERAKEEQPKAVRTAETPPPVAPDPDAGSPKAVVGGGARTVRVVAAEEPEAEREALVVPHPKLAVAETGTKAPVPGPLADAKACTGSCLAKSPLRRRARLPRISATTGACPLWGFEPEAAARLGLSAFCPVAPLP